MPWKSTVERCQSYRVRLKEDLSLSLSHIYPPFLYTHYLTFMHITSLTNIPSVWSP